MRGPFCFAACARFAAATRNGSKAEMSEIRTQSRYLDELKRRVLIYDGAMGTNIQRYNLSAEDFGGKALEGCNDNLVLTRPDVIQAIHESFLAVGSDVVETCTFQSQPPRPH